MVPSRQVTHDILINLRSSATGPIAQRNRHAISSDRVFHSRGQLYRRNRTNPWQRQAYHPGTSLLLHLGADRESTARCSQAWRASAGDAGYKPTEREIFLRGLFGEPGTTKDH